MSVTQDENGCLPLPLPKPMPKPQPMPPPSGRRDGAEGADYINPLHDRYHELVHAWPEEDRRGVDLGAQRWILLVDSGEIGYVSNGKSSTVEDILAGLERWKSSDLWAKEGGRYIPAIGSPDGRGWLDKRAWRDHPKQAKSQQAKQQEEDW